MRTKLKPLPQEGDRRIKAKYLWLPKTINGEQRWLEWATYEQRYVVLEADGSFAFWENLRWVSPAESEREDILKIIATLKIDCSRDIEIVNVLSVAESVIRARAKAGNATVPYDCDCGICPFCNGQIKQESPDVIRSKATIKTAVIIELEEQALMFREMAAAHVGLEASAIKDCAILLLNHAKAIENDECKLAALCEPKYQDEKGNK